jgi:hypothetical protein
MEKKKFYEYETSQYGDGILLDEYRQEFSLVAAKRKDDEIFMEWVFPQKRDGSRGPIDKSLPWKIKLGPRAEAIKVLKFFLRQLEGESAQADHATEDTWGNNNPPDDDSSMEDTWGEDGPSDDDIPF